VEIPAEKIFAKNVPRIPLWLLAELLPDHLSSSDGMVKLPAARLAITYHLVEHAEELIPEPTPEPELLVIPEIVPDTVGETGEEEPVAGAPSVTIDSPPVPETKPPAEAGLPPEKPDAGGPEVAPLSIAPPPPVIVAIPPDDHVAKLEVPAAKDMATIPAPPASVLEPPAAPPVEKPAPESTPVVTGKFPARRLGAFVGLPLFRRKTPAAVPQPAPPAPDSVELPPVNLPPEKPDLVLPRVSIPATVRLPREEPPVAAAVEIPKPVPPIEPEPEPEPDFQTSPAVPVRMLRTEHFPDQNQGQEIVEQEPLQALFLTEETMTVGRVIELCGGLPGVNSCVLAHGSVVVASHNVPDGVDLVSMSAHAADMLKAMRDSSARMGVGTVPAVTLHTEKGVISFFNRDDLTMLVFHRDRGFVPGVREKMAAVLGELTKARLTLPVGGDEDP
jgi:predicted regulator of Ras-like GTPase activity (Roadblock/LC7/MglB family)